MKWWAQHPEQMDRTLYTITCMQCGRSFETAKPVHFVTVIILETGVQGTHIAGGVVRTAVAVHIAGQTLGRRADTASVVLLGTAVCIDVAVVVIKLLLGARNALLGGAEIDVVLIVIGLHKKFLRCRFLETEELVGCKMGVVKEPQS